MTAVRFVHLKYLYRFEVKAAQGLVSPDSSFRYRIDRMAGLGRKSTYSRSGPGPGPWPSLFARGHGLAGTVMAT